MGFDELQPKIVAAAALLELHANSSVELELSLQI